MLIIQGFVDENAKQLKETNEKTQYLEKILTKKDLEENKIVVNFRITSYNVCYTKLLRLQ